MYEPKNAMQIIVVQLIEYSWKVVLFKITLKCELSKVPLFSIAQKNTTHFIGRIQQNLSFPFIYNIWQRLPFSYWCLTNA